LRAALYRDYPGMALIDQIPASPAFDGSTLPTATPGKAPFVSAVQDFYLTNPIARASAVMAECSALARGRARQAAE
jgi:NADH-quinone oxidoreductase subunit G